MLSLNSCTLGSEVILTAANTVENRKLWKLSMNFERAPTPGKQFGVMIPANQNMIKITVVESFI